MDQPDSLEGDAIVVTSPASSRWKGLLIKTGLSAALLLLVVSSISWNDFMHAWRSVTWPGVVMALALLPVQLMIRVARWQTLVRSIGSRSSAADVTKTILSGYAFAVATPVEIGDVALRMHRHDELPKTVVAGTVILEKVTHSLLSLLPGVPAVLFVMTMDGWWASLGLFAIASLVALLVFGHQVIGRLRIGDRWPRFRMVDQVISAFSAVSRAELLKVIGWTCGILVVYVLQEYVLVNSVTSLGFTETWHAFWAGIGVRTVAPFFVMDLGVREASHVAFFGRFGVGAAEAMTVSLLMFAVNVLVPTIVGIVVFLSDRRGLR